MADGERQGAGGAGGAGGGYARGENASDPNEHRHGSVVHSHQHTGPHEHGDDLEYDEAHDPERPGRAPGER